MKSTRLLAKIIRLSGGFVCLHGVEQIAFKVGYALSLSLFEVKSTVFALEQLPWRLGVGLTTAISSKADCLQTLIVLRASLWKI